jgi:hypothetical protein
MGELLIEPTGGADDRFVSSAWLRIENFNHPHRNVPLGTLQAAVHNVK